MDTPIIYELKIKSNILSTDSKLVYSSSILQPKLSLGYNNQIHQAKNKTDIFNKFKSKKPYLVVNPYEHQIDNNDNDNASYAKKYFKTTR